MTDQNQEGTFIVDEDGHGVIVFLKEGVQLLGVVYDGKARVVVYRDTRDDDPYHRYELEFLQEAGWKAVLELGDSSIQKAINLFTKAKDLVASKT